MQKYNLTNKAVEDLSNIWNYTADRWSEPQADKYYKMLLNSCQIISENPNIGMSYYKVSKHLFWFKADHHIIFYRKLVAEPIEITRILHKKMDLISRVAD